MDMEDSQVNQNPQMGIPLSDNAPIKIVSLRRNSQRRPLVARRTTYNKRSKRDLRVEAAVDRETEDDDEKEELERKIVALQRIVPGGEATEGSVDKLFEETAGYILALQCQIKAMKVLASFIQGLDMEKAKFGA